jgi:ABC-type Fe3+/spermidine/putrescine transport system ATPase subunit
VSRALDWRVTTPEAPEERRTAAKSAPQVAVSLRGISKRFGAATALEPTTLEIYKGEFLSLLGPSGCGKTTLLRIIGGFEAPSSGDVLMDGRSVLGDPPYRRRTNMIFQHLALFPHLTVAGNIAFGLEMRRQPRDVIRRLVEEALALVRLPGYGDRSIEALSGGQRQRIAMARALVNAPDVLLLDEPLGALDLQLRLQMQDELRRLHQEIRSTFVFVTHDQGEAIAMSDRIAVMNSGSILQVGTPQEVYERPRVRFVAEFMGHSNFFAGRISTIGGDRIGHVVAADVPLACRIPTGVEIGTEVVFALRYERIEFAPATANAAGECGEVEGELVSASYRGPTIRSEVKVGGLLFVMDSGNTGERQARAIGETVRLRWALDGPAVLKD